MGCVYLITSPSGKQYVGMTKHTADIRWKKHLEKHKEGRSHALYAAMRKYGVDAFVIETIFEHDDVVELAKIEQFKIQELNTYSPNGYNLTLGGEGTVQFVMTDGIRSNMSEAQKVRFQDPDQRLQAKVNGTIGSAVAHKDYSEANKWSKGKKVRTFTDKLNHSLAVREAMNQPEVKAKVIQCAKNRAADPAWRKKISESKKGIQYDVTPEWAAAKLQGIKDSWADPIKKASRVAKNRATKERNQILAAWSAAL